MQGLSQYLATQSSVELLGRATAVLASNVKTTMDYSYFGGPQQPYNQFLGMQHSFAHGALDTDTTQSIVSRGGGRAGRPRNRLSNVT